MAVRAPPATSEAVTKSMKANKGSNTKPEAALRRALRDAGYPGYRMNWKGAPGKPDIAYPGKKIAIFVNGCFWHRCPKCDLPVPKSHSDYWTDKFERNVRRDAAKTQELSEAGWEVIVVWECDLKKRRDEVVSEIAGRIERRRAEAAARRGR